jgi:hypothetical protein
MPSSPTLPPTKRPRLESTNPTELRISPFQPSLFQPPPAPYETGMDVEGGLATATDKVVNEKEAVNDVEVMKAWGLV